ncbi:MAG: DUF1194 domain-containing protein, partial [Pseudomonadota bacterium]
MLSRVCLFFALSCILPVAAKAQSCAHALLLGLDVSLSVDAQDFALQRQGLANALLDPDVSDTILHMPGGHVELAIFEWSGQHDQNLLINWTVLDNPSALQAVAQDLMTLSQMDLTGRTGIGAAMLYAHDLMLERPRCARHTFDISGDGHNNSGPAPESIRAQMDAQSFIVNALVIENNFNDPEPSASPPLGPYFRDHVITGPAAFVEIIFGFENYEEAMRRKLLRELRPAIARDRPGAPDRSSAR